MEDTSFNTLHSLFKGFLKVIGEDPTRDGLKETPLRAARAWEAWTDGYEQEPEEVLKTFDAVGSKGMVFEGRIPFYSHCEHHLATFFGYVHIGYLPADRIIGLSKMARAVDIVSRRLQIQERIGMQLADAFEKAINPRGVGVVVQARHMCMESRGIRKPGVFTLTSEMRGVFLEGEVRAEFMQYVHMASQGAML